MSFLPKFNLRSPLAAVFAPTERFFLRLVPLAPDLPAVGQVELALEGLAPFPLGQLYWGYCVAPDRTQAFVYAAHRRRFTAAETAAWAQADLVVPDILALIGAAYSRPTVAVFAGDRSLGGAAWSGRAPWPVAVHSRSFAEPPSKAMRQQFAAELAAKAQLTGAPVRFLAGRPQARNEGESLILELAGADGSVLVATTLVRAAQPALDVRDRDFLAGRRRDQNRGEAIGRVLMGGLAAAVLALACDVGALALRGLNGTQYRRAQQQAPFVQELETAHALSSRIDELAHRRLRFFEMLSSINELRPRSIQFTRTGTNGQRMLEIEAQTNSADDVGTFETALRKLATLDKVEIRDLRARDGVTTFALSVAFRSDSPPGGRR
jgi:Tfp pilus assembly protein PilN